MKIFKYIYFFVFLAGCSGGGEREISTLSEDQVAIQYPLPKNADSLSALLKTVTEDTNKVRILNAIAWKFYTSGDNDSSLSYAKKAQTLASQLKYQQGEADAYNTIGSVEVGIGNYPEGLLNHLAALHMREELKNKTGIAKSLMNIGIVYEAQADYSKALEYYFEALTLCKELNNENGIEITSGNIGNVYYGQHNYPKALDYYLTALTIAKKIGNKNNEAAWLGNIGIVNSDQSIVSKNQHERDSLSAQAFIHFNSALQLATEIEDKSLVALNMGNIGTLHLKNQDYQKAEVYLKSAELLSDSIGDLDGVKEWKQNLSELYFKTGKYERAYVNYKLYVAAKDSLQNDENIKQQTQLEMNYEFKKKEASDSIRNAEKKNQDDLKHNHEIQQQKTYTYVGVGGFALMLIVAGISFRAFRNKQKANAVITHQKLLVEEKQKEILDSIHYAKRIQKSLMPTEKYINKNLVRLREEERVE